MAWLQVDQLFWATDFSHFQKQFSFSLHILDQHLSLIIRCDETDAGLTSVHLHSSILGSCNTAQLHLTCSQDKDMQRWLPNKFDKDLETLWDLSQRKVWRSGFHPSVISQKYLKYLLAHAAQIHRTFWLCPAKTTTLLTVCLTWKGKQRKKSYILVILQENMEIAIFAEHRMRSNPLQEDLMWWDSLLEDSKVFTARKQQTEIVPCTAFFNIQRIAVSLSHENVQLQAPEIASLW